MDIDNKKGNNNNGLSHIQIEIQLMISDDEQS